MVDSFQLPEAWRAKMAEWFSTLISHPLPAVPHEPSKWMVLSNRIQDQEAGLDAQQAMICKLLAGPASAYGFLPITPNDADHNSDYQQERWSLYLFEWENNHFSRASECIWTQHILLPPQLFPGAHNHSITEIRACTWRDGHDGQKQVPTRVTLKPAPSSSVHFETGKQHLSMRCDSKWICETETETSNADHGQEKKNGDILPLVFRALPVPIKQKLRLEATCSAMHVGDQSGCAPCIAGAGCKWTIWPYCHCENGFAWLQRERIARLEPEGYVENRCLQATLASNPRPKRGYARRQTIILQLKNGWQCCFTWLPSPDPDQGRVSPGPHFATWAQISSIAENSPPPRQVHAELTYRQFRQPSTNAGDKFITSRTWYPVSFRLFVPDIQLDIECTTWPKAETTPEPQIDGSGMEYWNTPLQITQGQLRNDRAAVLGAVGFASFRGYETPEQAVPRWLRTLGFPPTNVFLQQVFLPRPPPLETMLQANYILHTERACLKNNQRGGSSSNNNTPKEISLGFHLDENQVRPIVSQTPNLKRSSPHKKTTGTIFVLLVIIAAAFVCGCFFIHHTTTKLKKQ